MYNQKNWEETPPADTYGIMGMIGSFWSLIAFEILHFLYNKV